MAKDSEMDKGNESITPPAPKKSFLDQASNTAALITKRNSYLQQQD
jgi:hypothetical protein